MRRFLICAALPVLALAASCGASSPEDRMVSFLSEAICTADQVYNAMDTARTQPSSGSIMELIKKSDDVAKKIDGLKSDTFGSAQQLQEAKDQVKDKKAVVDRAIAEAKKKCSPSDATIEQATRDYK